MVIEEIELEPRSPLMPKSKHVKSLEMSILSLSSSRKPSPVLFALCSKLSQKTQLAMA
jgi:hypothetical protein